MHTTPQTYHRVEHGSGPSVLPDVLRLRPLKLRIHTYLLQGYRFVHLGGTDHLRRPRALAAAPERTRSLSTSCPNPARLAVRLAIGLARGVQRSKVGPVRAIGATPLEGLRPSDADDLDRRCDSIGFPVALGHAAGRPRVNRLSAPVHRSASAAGRHAGRPAPGCRRPSSTRPAVGDIPQLGAPQTESRSSSRSASSTAERETVDSNRA
ncbi:MAG: hypothetical protein K0Q60_4313 [Microvirga sp.]|nr:hypothetical protein [Microvirga sp.]